MLRKTILGALLPCCSFLIIVSCGKEDDNTSPTPANNVPEIQAQRFNASEAIDDASLIGKVAATDSDGDVLTFSIKTNSGNLFEITSGGDISLASGESLDYETATSHTLSIDVTDGEATSNADVTINVIDVNENQAPTFIAQTFSAQEIVTGQGGLVATLVASDPDNDDITFSWDPNDTVTTFQLDETTGEIRTVNNSQGNLDFETTPQYMLSVIASDGELTTQADITINVTDFNDRPEASDQTFTAAEDIDDSVLIGQIVATDQDGDNLTFSVDIDFDLKFDLSSTGELRLRRNTDLDFETKTSHIISVDISDGTETTRVNITVDVTDVDENTTTTVSTFAGSSSPGISDGIGGAARFRGPSDVYRLDNGDFLVTDRSNRAIRKITATGTVTTLLRTANFSTIQSVVSDDSNNLYVSDNGNSVIWKLTPSGNTYTEAVFAGTRGASGNVDATGTAARFNRPNGLAIDANNNLYVADGGNGAIRKITPSAEVTTVATLPVAVARRAVPFDVVVTSDGTIFTSDNSQHVIFKIAAGSTTATTTLGVLGIAGSTDGVGSSARLYAPSGMVVDNNTIYLASSRNHNVRKIDINTDTITTIAGPTDGTSGYLEGAATDARFNNPLGITIDASGNLFLADISNNAIRKITFPN